jgi:hypothetical protein
MAEQDPGAQHRAAAEQIVARIASDLAYRRALLDDPSEALETLRGLDYGAVEVVGYGVFKPRPACKPTCPKTTCKVSCKEDTCRTTCNETNVIGSPT